MAMIIEFVYNIVSLTISDPIKYLLSNALTEN